MINPKRLAQLAKKWQRMAATGRRRIETAASDTDTCCTATSVADKGHCVVYTVDGRRFEVPLAYLGTAVFGELLRMSQEEFGFTSREGRITVPCDAAVMEYVMCLLRRKASEEVERAFLSCMLMPCHYATSVMAPVAINQQFAVCSS